MEDRFVLRASFGPPDLLIYSLYSETPKQENYIVKVKKIESAQRLMAEGYELIEDPNGQIDPSKKPLSPDEAAEVLSTARSTVYKYLNNGRLVANKTEDGRYRISRSSVMDLRKELKG